MSRKLGIFACGGLVVLVVTLIFNAATPPPLSTHAADVEPKVAVSTAEPTASFDQTQPTASFDQTSLEVMRAAAPDVFAAVETLKEGPTEIVTALVSQVGERYETQVYWLFDSAADPVDWIDMGSLSCVVTAPGSKGSGNTADCDVNPPANPNVPANPPTAFTAVPSPNNEVAIGVEGYMVTSTDNGGRTLFDRDLIRLGDTWSIVNSDGQGERSFKFTGYATVAGQACITVVENSITEQELLIEADEGGGQRVRYQNHIEATHYLDYSNHRLLRTEQILRRTEQTVSPLSSPSSPGLVESIARECVIVAAIFEPGQFFITTDYDASAL